VVSTTKVVVALSTKMLLLKRLSFLLAEWQTSQGHAIMGTPLLVPVPRNVIFKGGECTGQKYGIRN